MHTCKPVATSSYFVLIGGALLALGGVWPLNGIAQDKSKHAHQADTPTPQKDKQPQSDQKHDMRKMGGHKHDMGAMSGPKPSGWWYENYNRDRKQGMAGMKGMPMNETDAGSTETHGSSSVKPVTNDDVDLMGMRFDATAVMGIDGATGADSTTMKRMSGMKLASSQLGIPGVSHLYHIGATGLFLNHAEHIALTTKQQAALNVIKQKALLSKATAQRKIDEAEQELWELTGADEPDLVPIQAKLEAIEKLRGEQRLAFIRSVAESAKILTDEQREVLLGTKEPDTAPADVPSDK